MKIKILKNKLKHFNKIMIKTMIKTFKINRLI